MGTHGTGLFSDDTACDVRDAFVDLLAEGASPADATRSLIRSWAEEIADVEDGPVFWLALAATQWTYGCLDPDVRARALGVIGDGTDLLRWEGPGLPRRRAVLAALRAKLLSPPPAPRRPRRRSPVVVTAIEVPSPDGRAIASAVELTNDPRPGEPRMQVVVEMQVGRSRGGGGVMTADCAHDAVELEWLEPDTLRITHPGDAAPGDPQSSLFYSGRTIRVVYRARTV